MGAPDFANLPHIGAAIRRKEDYRFLTGAGNYTDDIVQANQAFAVFVRSPHAHANVKSIDLAKDDRFQRAACPTRQGVHAPA